jgi:hypothetical protein
MTYPAKDRASVVVAVAAMELVLPVDLVAQEGGETWLADFRH